MKMGKIFAAVMCTALALSLPLTLASCDAGEDVVLEEGESNGGSQGGSQTPGGEDVSPSQSREWVETFAGYDDGKSSTYYASTGFVSTATGVKWTLRYGTMSLQNDCDKFDYGACFTMGGKTGAEDDGQSTITSSVLAGGVRELTFGYIANAGKTLEVQVLAGGGVVWTSGDVTLQNNGVTGDDPIELTYTVTGADSNAVIRFVNKSGSRRISIGNLGWKSVSDEDNTLPDSDDSWRDDFDIYSNLEGDVNVTGLTAAYAVYWDDYYGNETRDWLVELMNDDESEYLCTELLTSMTAQRPTNGTYPIDFTADEGTALAGFFDAYEYQAGTWYMLADGSLYEEDSELIGYANGFDGKITVSGSSNSTTVKFDIYDGYENHITGTFTGHLYIEEGSYQSANAASVKQARKMARRSLQRFSSLDRLRGGNR